MNIRDLDFQNVVRENKRILGGQSAFESAFESTRQQLLSLTGQVVGNLNAISDVTASGTNKANVSVISNMKSETVNKVSISYGTITSAFATTPGS